MAVNEHPPHEYVAPPAGSRIHGCVHTAYIGGSEYVCGNSASADIHRPVVAHMSEEGVANLFDVSLTDWQRDIMLQLGQGEKADMEELTVGNVRAFHLLLDMEFKRVDAYKRLLGATRDALNKAVKP